MVKSGFTELVDGNTLGKIEAAVEVNPPNKNKDEKTKPELSFLKDLILNSPKSPVNVMIGKIQSQGVLKKL